MTGFDGHRQRRKAGGLLAPVLPAGLAMGKAKLGDDLAGGVDDDDVMGLLRPIKTGEVSVGGLRGGHGGFLVGVSGSLRCSGCLGFCP